MQPTTFRIHLIRDQKFLCAASPEESLFSDVERATGEPFAVACNACKKIMRELGISMARPGSAAHGQAETEESPLGGKS